MDAIAIMVGALAGAVLGQSPFGALVCALLGWLIVCSTLQRQHIRQLQADVTSWRTASGSGPRHETTTLAPPPAPVSATAAEGVPPPMRTTVQPIPVRATPPAPSARPEAAPAEPPRPDLVHRARAWLLGGNTIARAGIGILFIGLAFLAKYASDHAVLPVEFRLSGIAGVALVLLGVGWRLRAARPSYAQALQGGAVAVLYLTLFVAFRFYGVLAGGPVFALMVAVAGLAAALAVLQDARGLAVIGALGGFATPMLVSSGSDNPIALFGYYLVLDLGIAAMAWFRNWRLLDAVGFVFTFGVAAWWGVLKYEPADYAAAQAFLIAWFLLFNAVMLMPARRLADPLATSATRSDGWVDGGLLFGVPTISFVLQHGLMRDTAYGTALSALALAISYGLTAVQLRKNRVLAVVSDAMRAIATVFIALAIPYALDAASTGGVWALEGAGLLWIGFRQQRRIPRVFGHALLLISGLALIVGLRSHGAPETVFNAWFLDALLLAAGSLAGAFFVHRGTSRQAPVPREAMAEALLIGWGLLWALGAAACEIDRYATDGQGVAAWLVALSVLTLVCTTAALRLRWRNMGRVPSGLAPVLLLLAVGVSVAAAAVPDHPAQGGWWAWPLALVVQALVLKRLADDWPATLRHGVHAIGACVLAVLGAHWGGGIAGAWGDSTTAWPWLGTLAVPAVLLLVLCRDVTATCWPVNAEPAAYRVTAGAVIAFALLLWTVLANGVSTGAAGPWPYVPLLDPLDLGVATALAAVRMWLRQSTVRARLTGAGHVPAAMLAGAAFFWINAMLLRAFHDWSGVPYRLDAWMDSLSVQTGVTLLWAATALPLMWLTARRAQRTPWMVGAGLLTADVAKLLLVDLSGSGTVTRIVSFIGVGLSMLVIAYVAPLPASERSQAPR